MADFDVDSVASLGVIDDIPAHQLPPEAWSLGLNVRMTRDGAERMGGQAQVLGTLTGDPHFIMPIRTSGGESWWIYADLTAVYAIDSTPTEADISRAAPYTATAGYQWNGTWLGGIPILNNGVDKPQFWSAFTLATDLADLTNWPANDRAKVIRAFGPNLVAINITSSGTAFPHLVQWSHPADPGSLPSSWDYTDPTVDAGRNDLADTESGVLVDALPLRGQMILYKEGSTWVMRRVDSAFIFQFDQFLVASGLLTARCVAGTPDGKFHFAVTQDDIILHDGISAQSIIDKRRRRTIFNRLDVDNYKTCFVFAHPQKREMWFCYPESGATQPSLAAVWGYGAGGPEGVWYDAEVNFRCAATGDIDSSSGGTWDADSEAWDDDEEPWSTTDRRKVVVGNVTTGKILQIDSGLTRDGAMYNATLQRTGLAILGRRRTGEPIVDFKARKFVRRIWPKIIGGPVNVRLGFQDVVDGSVTWTATQSFDPTTQMYVDFAGSGRAVAVEFSTSASLDWRLNGYKMEVTKAGNF